MHEKVAEAIQQIDAAVFNGDTFDDLEEREKFRAYVESWLRALDEADRAEAVTFEDENPAVPL